MLWNKLCYYVTVIIYIIETATYIVYIAETINYIIYIIEAIKFITSTALLFS